MTAIGFGIIMVLVSSFFIEIGADRRFCWFQVEPMTLQMSEVMRYSGDINIVIAKYIL